MSDNDQEDMTSGAANDSFPLPGMEGHRFEGEGGEDGDGEDGGGKHGGGFRGKGGLGGNIGGGGGTAGGGGAGVVPLMLVFTGGIGENRDAVRAAGKSLHTGHALLTA